MVGAGVILSGPICPQILLLCRSHFGILQALQLRLLNPLGRTFNTQDFDPEAFLKALNGNDGRGEVGNSLNNGLMS